MSESGRVRTGVSAKLIPRATPPNCASEKVRKVSFSRVRRIARMLTIGAVRRSRVRRKQTEGLRGWTWRAEDKSGRRKTERKSGGRDWRLVRRKRGML